MSTDMAQNGLRGLIFTTLGHCPRIWPKMASEGSFRPLWGSCPRIWPEMVSEPGEARTAIFCFFEPFWTTLRCFLFILYYFDQQYGAFASFFAFSYYFGWRYGVFGIFYVILNDITVFLWFFAWFRRSSSELFWTTLRCFFVFSCFSERDFSNGKSFWPQNRTREAAFGDHGPKSRKRCRKLRQKGTPGVPFRPLWSPKVAARALLDQLEGGLDDILAQLCGHGPDFLTTFAEKL